jgi:glucuronate isomerase
MVTDSRSFISYTRHEYFRKVLCNLVGQWAVDGEVPLDMELLGEMVRDISFNNSKDYLSIS